ncbi:hypothetical protein L249_5944 [Ophiocordyceps polyrhachis-furcata BCC 54312]|uniref:Sfi1 spindle body domain-containing protein n=1 Tax=Ophiocordyceps polyrhachis-furcata BCC 54312 TaxID=1330021 RepID=A0A367LIT1_9HYPO|nr:hypothetical protein L249_5944 [Ophiocordyceps polyrhachis-furcata BCC 54312]
MSQHAMVRQSTNFAKQRPQTNRSVSTSACLLAQMVPSSKQSSDNGYRLNPTLSRVGHDLYYSNQDITILHSVVVAAQQELDHAPEPKPLPAAVLFRAYDEVLPAYGVDPDLDHHLSAFIFRIGGEEGHETLLSKFQAILGRMGIVLEFGDNTPTPDATPSLSLSPASSHQAKLVEEEHDVSGSSSNSNTAALSSDRDALRSNHSHGGIHAGQNTETAGIHANAVTTFRSPRDDPENQLQLHSNERESAKVAERPSLDGRRSALVAALDVWRSRAAASGSQHKNHQYGSDRNRWGHNGERPQNQHQPATIKNFTSSADPDNVRHKSPRDFVDTAIQEKKVLRFASAASSIASLASEHHESRGHNRLDRFEDEDVTPSLSRQNYLLHCATRARLIYLASKVLNHWADRTATRLEREAVARRHMIRFRCFRSWSQAPSSRLPAVDKLRASAAIQKLQRAVTNQRTQLSRAESSVAEAHSIRLVQQALSRWACQASVHDSLCRSARRTRFNAAARWIVDARETEEIRHAATAHSVGWKSGLAMHKWRAKTEYGSMCQEVAHHIRAVSLSSAFLDYWSDYAEVKRRSLAYWRECQRKKASFAFYVWNLSARAQAARWRHEYLSVEGAFMTWQNETAKHDDTKTAARQHNVLRSKSSFCQRIKQHQSERAELKRLEGRAQLFLNGTLLLKVFEATAQQRKDQMRNRIRQYLMMRYTQISSRRKKRNFLAALDRWKLSSESAIQTARMAQDISAMDEAGRFFSALGSWCSQAAADWRLRCRAESQFRRRCLQIWVKRSAEQEYRNARAGMIWTSERQRRCVKLWSIATLRRSGQAHTADMVLRRHDRESRGRALQKWKTATKGQQGLFSDNAPSVSRARPSSLSGQRRREKQAEVVSSLMETPTRWTGLPLSMAETTSSRRMTPVIEADDETQTVSGNTAADARAWKSQHGESYNTAVHVPQPSSTTPFASVPAHLRRNIRPLSSSWGRLGSATPLQDRMPRPDRWQFGSYSTGPGQAIGSGPGSIDLNPTTPKRLDSHLGRSARWQGTRIGQAEGSPAASMSKGGEVSRGQGPLPQTAASKQVVYNVRPSISSQHSSPYNEDNGKYNDR